MANQRSVLGVLPRNTCGRARSSGRKKNTIALLIVGVATMGALCGSGCAGVVGAAPGQRSGGSSGTPTSATQPSLTVTPTSASFANVPTGSSSSQTIRLSNTGTANLTISQAAVSGTGFSTSGLTVPLMIAPGQAATFNALFTPATSGNAAGSIVLTSNAQNSPLMIALSGSAIVSTRLLTANLTNLSFGNVLMGNSSSLSVTLTNSGNSDVTISSLPETGAGFLVTGISANTTLTPGQTALLNVSFAPTVAGNASGTVGVNSNASSPILISLSGNGVQQSTHSVALTWDLSTSDVVGYYVYRGTPGSGVYVKLNSAPVVNTQFTDTSVGSGQAYGYVVTAVDADNVESVYSNEVQATIP